MVVVNFNVLALRTISGAIFHCIKTNNQKELSDRDWQYLRSYLHLDPSTVYHLEGNKNGFVFTCRALTMKYVHHAFHSERTAEVQLL
jgi:hypothetical protein